MTQLISTLNAAYEVPEGRSWLKVHLISLGLTVVLAVLIVTALLLVLAGGHLVGFVGQELSESRGTGCWQSAAMDAGSGVRGIGLCADLLLRARCQGTALVLDHPRVSSGRAAMGVAFTRATWLPSLLQ
jgi:hypothetical protein